MSVPPTPAVPVTVFAPQGIRVRYRHLTTMVEFAPGLRYRLSPGANQFLLPPGRYTVSFWSPYVWMSVAAAQLTVDVYPGTPVALSYATPSTIYGQGVAGFGSTPPPSPKPVREFVTLGCVAAVVLAILAVIVVLSTR